MRKKFDDTFNPVDIIHQRDRRTDKRTDTGRQQRPRLRIASHGETKTLTMWTSVSILYQDWTDGHTSDINIARRWHAWSILPAN